MKEQQYHYEYTTSCGVCYLCTILAGGGDSAACSCGLHSSGFSLFSVDISDPHGVTSAERPQHIWKYEDKLLAGLTEMFSQSADQGCEIRIVIMCFSYSLSYKPLSGNLWAPSGWSWKLTCSERELSLDLAQVWCWTKTGSKMPSKDPTGPEHASAERFYADRNR